jgi:hypothetical protein
MLFMLSGFTNFLCLHDKNKRYSRACIPTCKVRTPWNVTQWWSFSDLVFGKLDISAVPFCASHAHMRNNYRPIFAELIGYPLCQNQTYVGRIQMLCSCLQVCAYLLKFSPHCSCLHHQSSRYCTYYPGLRLLWELRSSNISEISSFWPDNIEVPDRAGDGDWAFSPGVLEPCCQFGIQESVRHKVPGFLHQRAISTALSASHRNHEHLWILDYS